MSHFTNTRAFPMFSRQWEAARDEVRDLDKYEPNWDGADADPVPLDLIQTALKFFDALEQQLIVAPDMVYPSADGSVFAEWHYASGHVQSVNIRHNRISIVVMDPDGRIVSIPSGSSDRDAACISDVNSTGENDAFEFALAA